MVELGKHGRNRTNVWDYASVNSMRGSRREDLALHPTVKPTGLVVDAIQVVTRRSKCRQIKNDEPHRGLPPGSIGGIMGPCRPYPNVPTPAMKG